jgi:hypothetical protein
VRDAIRALTLVGVAAIVVILALIFVLFVLILFMAQPAKPRLLAGQSPQDHEAQAEIEEHDIDEMIEARNERRRRLGRPEIGDDLVAEAQRRTRPRP